MRTLALRWEGRRYADLAAAAGPGARPAPAPAIAIRAVPEVLARHAAYARTLYTGLPTLVELGPVAGDADVADVIEYGNPFVTQGAPWTELVAVAYAMPVQIPTAGGMAGLHAMVVTAQAVDPGAESLALAPAISPVRNVRLDGRPLDAAVTGAAAAPTLTWDAPALGTATGYSVTVHAIATSPTGVAATPLATFHTRTTSLAIPATVLAGTSSYVLTITAIAAPTVDLTTRPFAGGLPYASADHVTALVTR